MKPNPRARPLVGISHVHLKVADIDRALAFYRDVLGFEVTHPVRLGFITWRSCIRRAQNSVTHFGG